MREQLVIGSQGQPTNLGKKELPEKVTPELNKVRQIYELNGFILKSSHEFYAKSAPWISLTFCTDLGLDRIRDSK